MQSLTNYLLLFKLIPCAYKSIISKDDFLILALCLNLCLSSSCFVFTGFRCGKFNSFASCNNFDNVLLLSYFFVTFSRVTKLCPLLYTCLCFHLNLKISIISYLLLVETIFGCNLFLTKSETKRLYNAFLNSKSEFFF